MKKVKYLFLSTLLALTGTSGLQSKYDLEEDPSELKAALESREAFWAPFHQSFAEAKRNFVGWARQFNRNFTQTPGTEKVSFHPNRLHMEAYDLRTESSEAFGCLEGIIESAQTEVRLAEDLPLIPVCSTIEIHNCILPEKHDHIDSFMNMLADSPVTALSLYKSEIDILKLYQLILKLGENNSPIETLRAAVAIDAESRGNLCQDLRLIIEATRETHISKLVLKENNVADFIRKDKEQASEIESLKNDLLGAETPDEETPVAYAIIRPGQTLDHLYPGKTRLSIEFKDEHWYFFGIEMHEEPFLFIRAIIKEPSPAQKTLGDGAQTTKRPRTESANTASKRQKTQSQQ